MIPAFSIVANGTDATGTLADRLLSLQIIDEDGEKADRAEITVDDRDGRVSFPDLNTTLVIALGYRFGPLFEMGQFTVDGVSGDGPRQTMTISATAADMKSDIRAPRTRAWENSTLADIVKTIAAEAKLKAVVGQSVAGAHWQYLAQTAESNLHFLTRIASTLDATTKPAGGRLIVQKRGEGKTAAGDAMSATLITKARLKAWRWRLDGRETYKSVEVEWSDTTGGAVHKVIKGSGTPKKVLRHRYASQEEATRAAKAEFDRAGRAGLTLSGTLAGFDPALFAGGLAAISGLRPEVDGDWQLTRVTHELGHGLVTAFEARRPQ